MDKLLENKVIFIAGAGRGIGAAAARLFVAEGAQVMLAARTESQLETLAKELDAAYTVCDLADPDSVRAAVDRTVTGTGGWTPPSTTARSASRQVRWTGSARRRSTRCTA